MQNEATKTPEYITSLFKPSPKKAQSRKVWSIDLETVWLPFFTASNTMGVTAIPNEAIGCPLRLGYAKDGSVRFSQNGRPVIRVAKDISDNVRLVRDNFIAGLTDYTNKVYTENEDSYNATVRRCIEAGKPIAEHDKEKLSEAMAKMVENAIADASKTEPDKEAVAV